MTETVVVTQHYLTLFERKKVPVVCFRCHKELRLGDEIVSRPVGRRGYRPIHKFYCVECWEQSFF